MALAESATQTDWSGGPGVYGPAATWGDTFFIADAMDWDTEPGQLKLIVNRGENNSHRIAHHHAVLHVVSVDMDIDGDRDVAYRSYGTGAVYWSRNSGTGWEPPGRPTTWAR
ncbi:MAG: hypothetical protein MZV70_43335 [Desulfobacterales bacterium]|nr:hypothetical protein [Desulfobacterales bacterium]